MSQTSISFYNTIGIEGKKLKQATRKAENQESLILDFFKRRAIYNSYTPADVWQIFQDKGFNWPITSVRRAMTNLTKKELLVKLKEQRKGIYGIENHTWKLKI